MPDPNLCTTFKEVRIIPTWSAALYCFGSVRCTCNIVTRYPKAREVLIVAVRHVCGEGRDEKEEDDHQELVLTPA